MKDKIDLSKKDEKIKKESAATPKSADNIDDA